MSTGYVVVLITVRDQEEGRRIADALVARRKAACVNMVPQVSSIFRWEGKTEDEKESLLIVKSRAELFPELEALVKELHSYEVPEIIALPIVQGHDAYLDWLEEETGPA